MDSEKPYFPFYWNWSNMINNLFDEDDDLETAKTMAFAIVRYASTGEIIDLGDKLAQRLFNNCLTYAIDCADKHYNKGNKGGRPVKLTDSDQEVIAQMRANGQTAKDIAEFFSVSEKTILRSLGWKFWQKHAS